MQLTINLPDRNEMLAFHRQRWVEVLADPQWNDTFCRIETNAYGQIVLSPPPGGPHGSRQFRIAHELHVRLGGHSITECPISTVDGVKGADVGWFTAKRYATVRGQVAFETAPEICVEILSPSNTTLEMENKFQLYFDAGAVECWLCDLEGCMSYYNRTVPQTKQTYSQLCPNFPAVIND